VEVESEEHGEDRVHEIEVRNCRELRGSMNYEIVSSREVIVMNMKDFKYKGVYLPLKMNSMCKRELRRIATIMPVEDDRDIPIEELITVEPREVILEAMHFRQETKYREVNNVDNIGLIIPCNKSMIKNMSANLTVDYVNEDGVKQRLWIIDSAADMIDAIPFASVVNSFLMTIAQTLESLVNDAYSHKFKWKIVHMHPLRRYVRNHIAIIGNDVVVGHGQEVDTAHVVEMYTTRRFWVEEHDYVYVQFAVRCIIDALMDDTFREEFYFAFSGIDIEYKKRNMLYDDFGYVFDYAELTRKLDVLLRDTQYHYTKGTIMENVIKMSEILDLDSDVYITKRHGSAEQQNS
jgi:hypothetical protein